MFFSGLEELLDLMKPKKKNYDEQHYNVHVYKVLPYPPGSLKSFFRGRKEVSGQ